MWEYSHTEGIAVIGGYVYHGSTLPGLNSKYIYGDYGSGKVWALQYDGGALPVNTLLTDTDLNISSFGVDEQNELYFCSLGGKIYVLRLKLFRSSFSKPLFNLFAKPNATLLSTPTSTSSPTLSPIPSPSPLFSPSPQVTSTPKPASLENLLLLYGIIIAVAFALTGAILFLLKKRQRERRA